MSRKLNEVVPAIRFISFRDKIHKTENVEWCTNNKLQGGKNPIQQVLIVWELFFDKHYFVSSLPTVSLTDIHLPKAYITLLTKFYKDGTCLNLDKEHIYWSGSLYSASFGAQPSTGVATSI